MAVYVALLHSIVLTPERRVIMAELRAMAEEIGLKHPRTLVSTGNLVFEARRQAISKLEAKLEAAFEARFGRHVDIIVRKAADWRKLVEGNPFPQESQVDGDSVAARVMRKPLADDVMATLEPYLTGGERITIVGGDLWCCFPGKPSESKLLSVLTTRRLGVGTSRNWNTIRRIAEMAEA